MIFTKWNLISKFLFDEIYFILFSYCQMKRPIQQFSSNVEKEGPKKRKIQPVFLGSVGTGLERQELSAASFPITNVGIHQTHEQQNLSETALRANPELINRVGSEGGGNADLGTKELEMKDGSMNGSSSFLGNASLGNSQKNQQVNKSCQLPSIVLESECELKPFPQAINLQNITHVDLPIPPIQKNLSLTILTGPVCGVDQILAKNTFKKGIKCAKIRAKFGRKLKWEKAFGSPAILMQANCDWTISTHEDNNLVVYCTRTGKISFSIHTNSAIVVLEIRNNICLTITTEGELSIWDLRKSIRILATSIRTLLLGCHSGTLHIIHASLSTNGVPILVLNNWDAFIFSRSLHSWLSLNFNRDFLRSHAASFQFISHSLPNGLISLLIGLLNCGKLEERPTPANMQMEDEWVESANEDAQWEMLLRGASELDAPEEYRLITGIYIQKLIKNGKIEKMHEFLEEIRQSKNILVHPEKILADIRPLLRKNGLSVDGQKKKEFGWSLSLLE